MRTLPVTNNAKGQQREITLKLGLQSTEAYFPYIAYVLFFCFLLLCKKQCPVKIHAANIEASKFVCFLSFFFKLFLKISQMMHTTFIYFSLLE